MNTYTFFIQDVLPRTDAVEYIILRAGKGKHKWSSIYVNSLGFSYLEGLIWDKYREYRQQRISKIPSAEWKRILEGFEIAADLLRDNQDPEKTELILKYKIVSPMYPISDIIDQIADLERFIRELSIWLQNFTKTEKSISIIKNYI
ncbi:hypothetical protein [Candidatus Xianfuyuplasma coldseepsis]|uniref:Uncharacterized protein n=1 Tax=Candidatus Xianfuyuplasma coldseepsis TaxID=2782163 RepID=A0A7L7KSM4_9MOLU|nr:hypothetical protein [Xianfuyuplasma coldseepsis]QMS85743.1 hypothetical protein G4Z02_08300 [Xianfuyuplasma coldseepsis]